MCLIFVLTTVAWMARSLVALCPRTMWLCYSIRCEYNTNISGFPGRLPGRTQMPQKPMAAKHWATSAHHNRQYIFDGKIQLEVYPSRLNGTVPVPPPTYPIYQRYHLLNTKPHYGKGGSRRLSGLDSIPLVPLKRLSFIHGNIVASQEYSGSVIRKSGYILL